MWLRATLGDTIWHDECLITLKYIIHTLINVLVSNFFLILDLTMVVWKQIKFVFCMIFFHVFNAKQKRIRSLWGHYVIEFYERMSVLAFTQSFWIFVPSNKHFWACFLSTKKLDAVRSIDFILVSLSEYHFREQGLFERLL